jgi:hypothetical protein
MLALTPRPSAPRAAASTLRRAAVVFLVAGAAFGLGMVVMNRTAEPRRTSMDSGTAESSPAASERPEPRIAIDPNRVSLLPDAALRLDMKAFFDAGAVDTP